MHARARRRAPAPTLRHLLLALALLLTRADAAVPVDLTNFQNEYGCNPADTKIVR
jgi:hypothetical protein